MRDSRRVAPAVSAPVVPALEPFAAADAVSDGGRSAMRVLAAAAQVPVFGRTPGPNSGPAAGPAVDGRIDLTGLATVPPLRGPTVTGAAAGRAADHVGGAMLPPPAPNTVSLSDGTRISFRAVEESLVPEYA
jgi:hypothetical protein